MITGYTKTDGGSGFSSTKYWDHSVQYAVYFDTEMKKIPAMNLHNNILNGVFQQFQYLVVVARPVDEKKDFPYFSTFDPSKQVNIQTGSNVEK